MVEQLRLARTKRCRSTHVLVCPKLMLPRWLRGLHKVCDVVLEMNVGQKCWSSSCHEPLMTGICFPFIQRAPWQLRNMPVFFSLSRMLRVRWKEQDAGVVNILKQVLLQVKRLDSWSEGELKSLLNGSVGNFLIYRKKQEKESWRK